MIGITRTNGLPWAKVLERRCRNLSVTLPYYLLTFCFLAPSYILRTCFGRCLQRSESLRNLSGQPDRSVWAARILVARPLPRCANAVQTVGLGRFGPPSPPTPTLTPLRPLLSTLGDLAAAHGGYPIHTLAPSRWLLTLLPSYCAGLGVGGVQLGSSPT